MYTEIHDLLVRYRSEPETDERKMYEDIKNRVGNVKYLLSLVFKLDGIIFSEILKQNLARK